MKTNRGLMFGPIEFDKLHGIIIRRVRDGLTVRQKETLVTAIKKARGGCRCDCFASPRQGLRATVIKYNFVPQ